MSRGPIIPARQDAGFSLTEVLVSVFIFALIGLIGVGLMSTSLSARDQSSAVLERTARIDTARTLLREDLGQLALRPARDQDGRTAGFVLAGDVDGLSGPGVDAAGDGTVILSFIRRGRSNPGMLRARSSLARVEYLLRDGDLVRRVLARPDGAGPHEAAQAVLVTDIEAVELEFLVGTSWTRRFGLRPGQRDVAPPRALRLRYRTPRLGEMEHVVLMAEADR